MHRGYHRRGFSPAVLLTMIERDRHGARSGAGRDDAALLDELRAALARHDDPPAEVARRARGAFPDPAPEDAGSDGRDGRGRASGPPG